jgi:hypothetical protein
MSNIQVSSLSSLAAGAVLSTVLGSQGTCAAGYAVARVSLLWFEHLVRTCVAPLYRVRPGSYVDSNAEFVVQASASSAPRMYVTKDPTVIHVAMLTVLLGICDATSAALPSSAGDAVVLACVALLLSCGVWRRVAAMVVVYKLAMHGVPGAPDLLRGLSLSMTMACSAMHLPRIHELARAAISIIVVIQLSYGPCTNGLRAVPVSVLVTWALHHFRAQPVGLLIIAAVWL